ncbi:hypothetical protein [Burkholderia ubonensis]|uniref:hypothetical protein n=1 Tax=Burkholderia ubonensis TaxID=101571 RepID=UPI000B2641FA|nr:hypothetical protein [Burkholderia ubonensis]
MDAFDHRVLGNKLDLFHQQDESPGAVFWHPRGMALYRVVEEYVRERMRQAGFAEVRTPQIASRALWEQSGHWEKFGRNMFSLDSDGQPFCLKPMSCPCHVQVFKRGRARIATCPSDIRNSAQSTGPSRPVRCTA